MKKVKFTPHPLAVGLLIAISGTSLAAENSRTAPVDDQDVITVTAPVLSPLEVVTSPKTPRQPVPASDGSDYLKTIPGFSQIRNGGSNGDPVFRGMFGSRLR
ncbi:TonB-dependent copper receptor, partial [Leclercia adecarboxylata]